ncbi:hypothetical protein GCM10009767_03660 [Kocuria aegyptia]|uniref:Uncharacterized protein n=1 Tax=Kocuria aegyptia TaxID=330943 RepID=A0ABP4WBE9_9MICC
MESTRSDRTMWPRNITSAAAETRPMTSVRAGTSTGSGASDPIPRSPVSAITNVETRIASTAWILVSRANSRSSRGENCWEASCRASTVKEKVRVVAVMIEVATTCSVVLAASGPPGHTAAAYAVPGSGRTVTSSAVTTAEAAAATTGQNHSLALNVSELPRALVLIPLISSWSVHGRLGRSVHSVRRPGDDT